MSLRAGRGLYLAVLGGFVVFVLATLEQLPPVVASHFDGAGVANGWSSRPAYAALLLLIGAGLPLGIVGLVRLLTRRGPRRLNLPARDYWLRPEHAPEAVRRVREYMWWLGCILTGTALAMHWLVLGAHRHDPPSLGTAGIVVVLVAVVGAIGLWAAGWYRLLRRGSADRLTSGRS
ncbi:MAG TPA: DUF1648 domain-containing protein [Gemmatimonadales bacterium]|nr:DUF1648 domain-containing protein [Gemmatimonadales bacterium]